MDINVPLTISAITCGAGTPILSIFNPVPLYGLYSETFINQIDVSISPDIGLFGVNVSGYIGVIQVASTSIQDTNISGVVVNIYINNPVYKIESNTLLTGQVLYSGIGNIITGIQCILSGTETVGVASEIIVNSSTVNVSGILSNCLIGQLIGDLSEKANIVGLQINCFNGNILAVLSPYQNIGGTFSDTNIGNINNVISTVIVLPTKKIVCSTNTINYSEGKYRYSRPVLDLENDDWKAKYGSSLYDMLNENIPQDSDYIYSQSIGKQCNIKMSDVANPNDYDGHTIRYKGIGVFEVTLWCGDTEIASWQESVSELEIIEHTLTKDQSELIHDYKLLTVSIKS
jgi:hypothetical protein